MDLPTLPPHVVDALADARRRRVLAALTARDSAATRAEIASELVGSDATDTDVERTTGALAHTHLPRLADAGAVTYDPDTGLVAAASESPFDRSWVQRLLTDHLDAAYDAVLHALASPRRQATLYELLSGEDTVPESALATSVAARESGVEPDAVPEATVRSVAISLAHSHLPLLVDAGFVAYDRAAGVVRLGELPWRRDPWVRESPIAAWFDDE
jgi:hypothetical protein